MVEVDREQLAVNPSTIHYYHLFQLVQTIKKYLSEKSNIYLNIYLMFLTFGDNFEINTITILKL